MHIYTKFMISLELYTIHPRTHKPAIHWTLPSHIRKLQTVCSHLVYLIPYNLIFIFH